MVKIFKKHIKKFIIAALILFAMRGAYKVANPDLKTEIIFSGYLENVSEHNAVIIRDETVVNQASSGTLQSLVPEGDMVKKGKHIATLYKGDIDPDIQNKLTRVNERIAEITSSKSAGDAFSDDIYKLESKIYQNIKSLVTYANLRNARAVSSSKIEIDTIHDKKNAVLGDHTSQQISISDLTSEKEYYENILSNSKEEIYSPKAGLFSAFIDGFEEVLCVDDACSITPDEFDSILKKEEADSTSANYIPKCKIIDTFKWCAALETDAKRAKDFSIGESVFLRVAGISKEIPAVIEYISDEKNGKCIIVAASSYYNPDISHVRKTQITLVKNTYSGLKVPLSAIREKDGKKGVYTVTDSFIRFKEVEIIYDDGEYAISKENNSKAGSLLLYDEVVISEDNLKEGKMVK